MGKRALSFFSHQVVSNSCDPMDCSLPGNSVHGILQARILEWVAMPFSKGSSRPRDRTHFSCVSCISRWVLLPLSHLGSPGHLSVYEIQHSRSSFLNRLCACLYRCHVVRKWPITFCSVQSQPVSQDIIPGKKRIYQFTNQTTCRGHGVGMRTRKIAS